MANDLYGIVALWNLFAFFRYQERVNGRISELEQVESVQSAPAHIFVWLHQLL